MKHFFITEFIANDRKKTSEDYSNRLKRLIKFSTHSRWSVLSILTLSLFFISTSITAAETSQTGNTHYIEMVAEKPVGREDNLAYRMLTYEVMDQDGVTTDITSRYNTNEATIPGPTIIMDEGDIAVITLYNEVPNPDHIEHRNNVSLHVHGVHYQFHSDGTLKYINFHEDQGATAIPYLAYEYVWNAAPGTAGTWPYHDHNMNTHNGAEDKGLFGALIVNPATKVNNNGNMVNVAVPNIKKDYVLYILDDVFAGTEIDNQTGIHTPLGFNPQLTAQRGDDVRFHLIALGTNLHQFELPGYHWEDAGTHFMIDKKAIGPLEKHVVAVRARTSTQYMDATFTGISQNMVGNFSVNP